MPILRATSAASASVEAARRIDGHFMDLFRVLRRDFLDVHAAFGRSHQGDALRDSVDDHADVELLLDVGALLDQQAPHLLSLRPRLVRDELHAEDLLRLVAHFVERFRDLDAAALAATARVDLRFDDPDAAAELLRRCDRLVDAERRDAAGRRDAELAIEVLALILVDFHRVFLRRGRVWYHRAQARPRAGKSYNSPCPSSWRSIRVRPARAP
jgi:hypothetical protein